MSVSYQEVLDFIRAELASLIHSDVSAINADTVLIGQNRVLDSADLVVLLLAVEDFALADTKPFAINAQSNTAHYYFAEESNWAMSSR